MEQITNLHAAQRHDDRMRAPSSDTVWPLHAAHAASEITDDEGPRAAETYRVLLLVILPLSSVASLSALVWLATWLGWLA